MRGQSGQVRWSGLSGGRGPWVSTFTEEQPSRWALPRQSALVSPPPRMTTFLPAAEISTAEFAAGHVEVASLQGADGEDDGVELVLELFRGRVLADVGAGAELDALLFHDGDAAVDDPLLDLVVGDAVSEEPPDPIVLLEDDRRVPGP